MRSPNASFYILPIVGILIFSACKKEPCTCDPIKIPDQNFLEALLDAGIDANGDGIISVAEADTVKRLYISQWQIADLTGIEHFTDLKELGCNENSITSLDLSVNTKLEILECSRNQLSSLDVSENPWLVQLWCMDNQIDELDVSMMTQLQYLFCAGNDLTELNVSLNGSLEFLYTGGNNLTSLNVSGNPRLKDLDCSGNPLTYLDISSNTQLQQLFLFSMTALSEVCVWILPFPPEGLNLQMDESPGFTFTTICKQ